MFQGDQKLVLDISDFEDESDEVESDDEAASGSECPTPPGFATAVSRG